MTSYKNAEYSTRRAKIEGNITKYAKNIKGKKVLNRYEIS